MTKLLRTATGEEHGLINTVANSVEDNDFKYAKEGEKEKLRKKRKEDAKIVKARYINYRGSNERLQMPYGEYSGDPLQTWRFIPNHEYEVPMGLVLKVNDKRHHLARRSEVLDANGLPSKKESEAEKIHEFVPVGF